MGQRYKSVDRQRNRVELRLTDEELALLDKEAKKQKVSIPEYIRRRLFMVKTILRK
jgi:uncharacterized protein (DUF1778 family)